MLEPLDLRQLCHYFVNEYANVPENIPLEPLSDFFATTCDCENANYSQITYHVEVAMLPGQIAQMQAQI